MPRNPSTEGLRLEWAALKEEVEQLRAAALSTAQIAAQHASALGQVESLTNELSAIQAEVQKHERLLRRSGPGNTLHERVQQVIDHYQNGAAHALELTEQFRADLIVQLRAFELVVDMAGNGATHSEKAARLRGLSEMLASGVEKLRDFKLDDISIWQWPDVFRTTFPVRTYIQRIHELEAEVTLLREHPVVVMDMPGE